MEFLGVLIACVAFIALLPYIRCFVKRLIFRSKIKKTCIKKAINFTQLMCFGI